MNAAAPGGHPSGGLVTSKKLLFRRSWEIPEADVIRTTTIFIAQERTRSVHIRFDRVDFFKTHRKNYNFYGKISKKKSNN
jgi:hypothetical protein